MNPAIEQQDGWFWPMADRDGRKAVLRDFASDIANVVKHVPGRDLIVQAGGNVGVYALTLALQFRSVVTCEPDPINFACLVKNVAARDALRRVTVFDAAFGAEAGACEPVEVEKLNCGAHRVEFGTGDVPVITIDSLSLTVCDAIWADVEGSELHLLQGAAETIERCGPVIVVEDKGLHRSFGIEDGALQSWLAERGYQQIDAFGRDKVFGRMK